MIEYSIINEEDMKQTLFNEVSLIMIMISIILCLGCLFFLLTTYNQVQSTFQQIENEISQIPSWKPYLQRKLHTFLDNKKKQKHSEREIQTPAPTPITTTYSYYPQWNYQTPSFQHTFPIPSNDTWIYTPSKIQSRKNISIHHLSKQKKRIPSKTKKNRSIPHKLKRKKSLNKRNIRKKKKDKKRSRHATMR